jgi:DNA-binding MarR family transcriptional regulator
MPKRPAPSEELIDRITTAFRRYQRSVDALDEIAAGLMEVNRTDARVLDLLQESGRMTAGEIATGAGLTSGAVTGVLDRLERAGYLKRVRDDQDRRRVMVEATPKLDEMAQTIYGGVGEKGARAMADYTAEELALVARFVRDATEVTDAHAAELRERRNSR